MTLVLAAHLLVAAAVLVGGRRLGRAVLLVGAAGPLAALIWGLSVASTVLGGEPWTSSIRWVEGLSLRIDFSVDAFSLLMVLLVGGIGVVVFAYAALYFRPRRDLGGFTATLVAFCGAMLGVVTSDNVLMLFVFWELTSITSYLLIGFDDRSATARASALKALLVTGSGGLVMMGGLIMLAQEARTYSLAGIIEAAPVTPVAMAGLVLVLVGCFSKSAQVPFHFWLPGAMAAPTPVSAYLHSATMVKAGIYVIARLAPVFAPVVGWWRPVVMTVGLVTMILGAWRALSQEDAKLLLAFGTVSQLGFITVLVGYGDPRLTLAGAAVILAHAVFKASLFMVVGVIDTQVGTRRLSRVAGWARSMPVAWWTALVAAASMVGLPPLLGFVAKEEAFRDLLLIRGGTSVFLGVIAGSVLTVAYSIHFFEGSRATPDPETEVVRASPPSRWFLGAPALLAAFSLLAGLIPTIVEKYVVGGAAALAPSVAGADLTLWHGLEPALAWSAAVVILGYLIWRSPRGLAHRVTAQVPEISGVYNDSLRYLNRVADRVTSIFQSGSLPVYLQIILVTAVALPGVNLIRNWDVEIGGPLVDSPLRMVVVVVVVLAAVGAIGARRRMGAVLFLGAIGYGVAVLFVLHGAPDLALTQLLVETLALAMFVMVLRHLPDRWEVVRWPVSQTSRVLISVAVGLLVGAFALWSASGRVAESISYEYIERALPDGGGSNVVNVILTDFRGFDTMGEITVIGLAAVGCIVLLGRFRRRPPIREESS